MTTKNPEDRESEAEALERLLEEFALSETFSMEEKAELVSKLAELVRENVGGE